MRRYSAAATLVLLGLIGIGAAEASLLALLALFSFILKLRLGLELGPAAAILGQNGGGWEPQVTVFNAGSVASFVVTGVSGLAAAAWRFGRWRPVA